MEHEREEKSAYLHIRVSESFKGRLQAAAAWRDQSESDFVRSVLSVEIRRAEREMAEHPSPTDDR